MGGPDERFGGLDPGEFLGVGLDTGQLGHLAGVLFLGLFGLSALRRVTRAPGALPVIWITVAAALLASSVFVAVRGFPEQVPDNLRPWALPDRLIRAATVTALLGSSLVLISAHWVRRPLARGGVRLLGFAAAGVAVWLAAGWFRDELPDEVRPWAARSAVSRGLAVIGLVGLSVTFWARPAGESPHRRWMSRVAAVPALGLAVVLGVRWFGPAAVDDFPVADVVRGTVIASLIATATCLAVTAGAYLLSARPARPTRGQPGPAGAPPTAELPPLRPLPVALLLDDQGRPLVPGSAGAAGLLPASRKASS